MSRPQGAPHARRGSIATALWRQILPALLLLGGAGPALAADPAPPDARMNLAYGPLPEEVGDLFLPSSPGPHPAVVVIHGGGWTEGSRAAWTGFATGLASQGVAAFNIDYRLAQVNRPDTFWPAPLRDAQLAVRFLRAHAAEFHIDPKRLGASGDSAGAQLALFLGSLPRAVAGDVAGQCGNQLSNVQAVVDQYGPVDIPGMYDGGKPGAAIMFGTPTPSDAQFRSASPLGSITAHSAPTLIIQGDKDVTVPPAQSKAVGDVLRAKRVPVQVVTYPGGHAYSGLTPPQVAALEEQAALWLVGQLRR